MNCSPLNTARIRDLIPAVLQVMQRQFPRVRRDLIVDAIGSAVEKCLTVAFLTADRTSGEIFCWLRTSAMNELRHEFRVCRRYVDVENEADISQHLTERATTDTRAMRSVLWNWLVSKLGASIAETVWLHEIEGCPPRDIAAIQGGSVVSIKARITRARAVLRRVLPGIS